MNPHHDTRVGDRVRRKRDGRQGVLGDMSDLDNPCVVWDDDPDAQVMCRWDELDAVPQGPGIGAVVAMVAAARMFRGNWGPTATDRELVHWDWVPWQISEHSAAACGDDGPYGITAGIRDTDCPACLRMYARVYGIAP